MKSPDAFRTISEVAEDLDLPQHVLRFWETRFSQIKPMKRGGGRRYYRPDDVALLRGIRILLYGEGYTIKGVQRLFRDKGVGFVATVGRSGTVETVTAETAAQAQLAAARDSAASETADQPVAEAPLVADDSARARLEAVIFDLIDAKRLLDQAR